MTEQRERITGELPGFEDMKQGDLKSIAEASEALGVTQRTLRFYEDKGLIQPARVGSMRVYSRREMGRMQLILRGKRFGFSLEDLRQLLDLYDRGDQQHSQIAAAYEVARERLADMERQRAELDAAIADLREQMTWGERMLASLKDNRDAAE